MEIREIDQVDLEQLLTLYRDLHEKDAPLSSDAAESIWREIQNNPLLTYFGGFQDNALVSSCTLATIPNLTRGGRPYGLIENVVTRKDQRRKGYGQQILRHALGYAWGRNCYKVMLMTSRLNEETYTFYESAGFDRAAKQAFLAKPEG